MTFVFSPDDTLLRSVEVDAGLRSAAVSVLEAPDPEVEHISSSIVHSYRLRDRTGTYHARVFRYDNFPVLACLRSTLGALEAADVLAPRLVHGERGGGHLPYGFMLTDWLDGDSASDLILNHSFSESEIIRDMGVYLARVHEISMPSFGPIGEPGRPSFGESLEALRSDIRIAMLIERQRITTDWLDSLLASFHRLLDQIGVEPTPVLTHGDPNRANVLVTKGQPLAMVDWDEAAGDVWIRDLAILTRLPPPTPRLLEPRFWRVMATSG